MTLRSLRTVAEYLPFHLDDTAQVNETFVRWHRHPTAADKHLVDLWTYCFIYRYFLIKFAPSNRQAPLCFDQLVANAFDDVQEHLSDLRQPERYTGWVGTICKNTFVNYLRTRRGLVPLDTEEPGLVAEEEDANKAHDDTVVKRTLRAAIGSLPAFLSDVARMRLLERRSYETISRHTGKPMATLRTYVNRALGQLRCNPDLKTLREELRD